MDFDVLFNMLTVLSIITLSLSILAQFVIGGGKSEHE